MTRPGADGLRAIRQTAGPAGPAVPRPDPDRYPPGMDRPPPDPAKLLAYWQEWERGDTPPGRVMANLKTGGLHELLDQLVGEPAATPPA